MCTCQLLALRCQFHSRYIDFARKPCQTPHVMCAHAAPSAAAAVAVRASLCLWALFLALCACAAYLFFTAPAASAWSACPGSRTRTSYAAVALGRTPRNSSRRRVRKHVRGCGVSAAGDPRTAAAAGSHGTGVGGLVAGGS